MSLRLLITPLPPFTFVLYHPTRIDTPHMTDELPPFTSPPADSTLQANTQTTPPPPETTTEPPKCYCSLPSCVRICQKEGPNKDRPYRCCSITGLGHCKFFQPMDDRPWIRGRTRGNTFVPFKRYREADPTIRASYSTSPITKVVQVDSIGIRFVLCLLDPVKHTALRVYPNLKILRSVPNWNDTLSIKKRINSGKSVVFAGISKRDDDQHQLTFTDMKDLEAVTVIATFIQNLAANPAKTLEDMSTLVGSCCVCGRELKVGMSISRGCGPVCYRRISRILHPPVQPL
jgi:hypothetical protein